VSIAAETALAYLQWCGTRERLAVAKANLAAQLETLQITQWRTQAGLATSLQLEQARAAAEQTRAQIPALEQTLAQSAHGLAVLTGRAPGALPELAASTAATTPTAAQRIALTIPADTLRQRPDVRRAEAQWRAALARTRQARTQGLPSLRLSGNIGLSALTLGALGGSGSTVAALLAGVSMPLLDGGAIDAQVRAQDAATEGAAATYRAAVLGALRDVEDALRALASAQERRATLQRAAEAAGNAALLADQRYRSGLVDFQVVLDTQRTQLSAQDSLAAAQTDVASAQVRLHRSLGGGWSTSEAERTLGADSTLRDAGRSLGVESPAERSLGTDAPAADADAALAAHSGSSR
jgi:NodT family efflux transporter outer membrane factor (OMF) lipoprotein